MKTGDFNSNLTSEVLNEQMYRTFGKRVNFEKYNREQLENYRNVLRTKVHQLENTSGFNELLANESYQENKHLLELLNTRIKEMLGEAAKKELVKQKAVSKQAAGIALAAKRKGKKPKGKGLHARKKKKVSETSDFNIRRTGQDFGDMIDARAARHVLDTAGEPVSSRGDLKPVKPGPVKTTPGPGFEEKLRAELGPQGAHPGDVMGLRGDRDKTATEASEKEPKKPTTPRTWPPAGPRRIFSSEKPKKIGPYTPPTSEGKKSKMKPVHGKVKKARKDWDGDGKIESPKDEVWGSRAKAAAKAGKPFGKKTPTKKKSKLGETYDYPIVDQEMANAVRDAIQQGTQSSFKYGGKSYRYFPAQQVVRPSNDTDRGDDGTAKELTRAYKRIYASTRGPADPKLHENQLRNNFRMILEGIRYYIAEDEEGKAMDITAGADMVKDFTSWMQRLGQYQTKSTIELADSIRSNFGPQEAEQFKTAVTPAIQSALEALTASREIITKAVSVLAGEEQPEMPMGEPGGEEEPPMEEPAGDSMNQPPEEEGSEEGGEDQFAASDAASAGRELRESRRQRQLRKLHEANSIMRRLAG